jgi:hypothetical protein
VLPFLKAFFYLILGCFILAGLTRIDAEELTLHYTLTTHYPNQEKCVQAFTEYYTEQYFCREDAQSQTILQNTLQEICWYFPSQNKIAKRSFSQQKKHHQRWKEKIQHKIKNLKTQLATASESSQKSLQFLIKLQTLPYTLTFIEEEEMLEIPCIKYQLFWGETSLGYLWVSKSIPLPHTPPFPLLEGPWDKFAEMRSQFTQALVKGELLIPSLEKTPILQTLELQSSSQEPILSEKFFPVLK